VTKIKPTTTSGRFMTFTDTASGSFREFSQYANTEHEMPDVLVYHKTPRQTKGTRLCSRLDKPHPLGIQ